MKRAGMVFLMLLWSGLVALFLMGAEESKTAKTSTTTAKSTKTASATPTKAKAKKDTAKDTKLTTSTKTAASVTSGTKTVYLMFDDGPSKNTPEVLDILKEKGVHATFFTIGNKTPELMKRVVDEGHAIGNHTYSHEDAKYKDLTAFMADVKKQEDLIFKATGVHPVIFRFPHGSNNNLAGKTASGENRMVDIRAAVEQAGYAYFDWNASSADYLLEGKTKEGILTSIKKYSKSKKGYDIVLMHDGSGHKATVEALPELIEYYKSLGYQFETLNHDSPAYHMGFVASKK